MHPSDNSALIRASKRAEWFWIAAIAVAVGVAVNDIINLGWEKGKTMLIIPAVASVWFGFRRNFRRRLEKQQG